AAARPATPLTEKAKGYKLSSVNIEEIEYRDPLDLFALLRSETEGPAFLLGGTSKGTSRSYSYIGVSPFMVIEGEADPFAALSELLKKYKSEAGPFPFSGGAVGYFSYDLRDNLINTHAKGETKKEAPLIAPSILGVYDTIVAIDHARQKSYLVERGFSGAGENSKMITALAKEKKRFARTEPKESGSAPRSNLTREEYISKVEAAKRYITEGDIYQINIAQKFEIPFNGDSFSLYRDIVESSPAPFSSFLDFGSFQIISNTPERLLKIKDGTAVTEPIKGTRKRGASKAEDLILIEELRGSPKERAEHVMIVDLERSDLGRICETGTVKVEEFERVLTLPGLHHMVSSVRGRLKEGLTGPEALKMIFPGGSITGAPKIRAMEIIDELEPTPRGLYTGALGWFDFSGALDIAMAIRTAVSKEATLHLGVGSGIVADSVPEEEYDETILKAKDFFGAVNKEKKIAK
ncbi:MAG: aminodeoxychorismate synthase component I, partial [Thermodesulfobacteriota bacterium]